MSGSIPGNGPARSYGARYVSWRISRKGCACSLKACMPTLNAGIATFGGDVFGLTDANGLPDAVRGLYISPSFPNGEQNTSGWADWRGTSFSTAIISALGAHLVAQSWSAPQAITRIAAGRERRTDKLFGSSPDIPDLLANVIRVQQRFRL